MRKLAVVGIGPGNYENMTIRADRALRECDVIVGYTVYVDLVKERYADKEFLTTPMLREVERCEMALETARGGKTVAMICSGDSGIYGMAALLYRKPFMITEHGIYSREREAEIIKSDWAKGDFKSIWIRYFWLFTRLCG